VANQLIQLGSMVTLILISLIWGNFLLIFLSLYLKIAPTVNPLAACKPTWPVPRRSGPGEATASGCGPPAASAVVAKREVMELGGGRRVPSLLYLNFSCLFHKVLLLGYAFFILAASLLSPQTKREVISRNLRNTKMHEEETGKDGNNVAHDWQAVLAQSFKISSPHTQRGVLKVMAKYGISQDAPESFAPGVALLRKNVDAEGEKDAEDLFLLGYFLCEGIGIPKEEAKAAECFRLAGIMGDGNAQSCLGWMFNNGVGVEKNQAEAFTWISLAAAQGHPAALCNLGDMWEMGDKEIGGVVNLTKAKECFEAAAAQDHPAGCYRLAQCIMDGPGVEEDLKRAYQLYLRAATMGCPFSQYSVGWMHATGTTVAKDDVIAIEWYKKAGDGGNPIALHTLGISYPRPPKQTPSKIKQKS